MHRAGQTYAEIGRALEMHRATARLLIDDQAREQNRQSAATRRHRNYHRGERKVVSDADAAACLAEMPIDDRSDAAKLMGDPPFARSALAQTLRDALATSSAPALLLDGS